IVELERPTTDPRHDPHPTTGTTSGFHLDLVAHHSNCVEAILSDAPPDDRHRIGLALLTGSERRTGEIDPAHDVGIARQHHRWTVPIRERLLGDTLSAAADAVRLPEPEVGPPGGAATTRQHRQREPPLTGAGSLRADSADPVGL